MRPLQDTRPYREAQKQLQRLQAQDPANAASMRVRCWAVRVPEVASRWLQVPMQSVAATVEMRRTLSNAYAGIPLRVMRMLATMAGVPFDEIDESDPEYALPGELTPTLALAMSYAQMDQAPPLDVEQERMLRQRYLHHSASWQVSGTDTPTFAVFYINRPTDDGRRVIIPNEDAS